MEMDELNEEQQIDHTVNVGPHGTYCRCFDGKNKYAVGDGFNSGASYSCHGGFITNQEIRGPSKLFAGKSHICKVTKPAILLKYQIANMCNRFKVKSVQSYKYRYQYLTNFMKDQMQRWGYSSSETHTKYDALHDVKDGKLIPTFSELENVMEGKNNFDMYFRNYANTNPATNKSFKFPTIMNYYTNLLHLM